MKSMQLYADLLEHFLLTAGHKWTAKELQLVVSGKKSAVYRTLNALCKQNFIIHESGSSSYRVHPRFIEPFLSYEKNLKKEIQWKKKKLA